MIWFIATEHRTYGHGECYDSIVPITGIGYFTDKEKAGKVMKEKYPHKGYSVISIGEYPIPNFDHLKF